MNPRPAIAGLVLAGGRSTRMGRDKALLTIDGTPMWQRQRDLLTSIGCTDVFVSARPEQRWAYAATGFGAVLNDALPDCGPIVGITAGLERISVPHLAVLAIDLPTMTAGWFAELEVLCAPQIGAVGCRDGFFEPLAAIYPQAMKWLAWEQVAAGRYSLQQLLRRAVDAGMVRVKEITPANARLFANWNTPEKAEG